MKQKKEETTKNGSVAIPAESREALKAYCRATGLKIYFVVGKAIEEYLAKQEVQS